MMSENLSTKELQLPQLLMKGVDMSQEKVRFAIEIAKKGFVALLKSDVKYWQDVAEIIKREFEQEYDGMWHVIVGQHFGAFVTHESHNMVYFSIGQVNFLIYKHG